jgi:hypothetical protein
MTNLRQAKPVATTAADHVKNEYGYCQFHTAVPNDTKLYTAPPQRPWVELTASTILNLMPSSIPADHDGALMEFARAIEAAHNIKEGT